MPRIRQAQVDCSLPSQELTGPSVGDVAVILN